MTEKREATHSSIPTGGTAPKGEGVAGSSATGNLPVGGPSIDPEDRPGQAGTLQDESGSHESAGGDSDYAPAERAAEISSTAAGNRPPIRLGIRDWTLVGAGVLSGLVLGLLLKRRN
jgi:hypothetical protein